MPLPIPTSSEKKDKPGKNRFVNCCMTQLKNEFPDDTQRIAVCLSQYRKSKKKS